MSDTVAKSGWLYRQSSILKKWKRNWFVLYTDGYLRYYENESSLRAEDLIAVPVDVIEILWGQQVEGVQPPPSLSRENLLLLKMRGRSLVLCADTPDDMKAWQLSISQARFIQPYRPYYGNVVPAANYPVFGVPSVTSPYSAYRRDTFITPQGYVYQVPPGQNMVIVDRPYSRRYHGTDLALGMVAGAALGTMMWTPLWWC